VKIALARQNDFNDLLNRRGTSTHHEYAISEVGRVSMSCLTKRIVFLFGLGRSEPDLQPRHRSRVLGIKNSSDMRRATGPHTGSNSSCGELMATNPA
jgi:hypothetical protein